LELAALRLDQLDDPIRALASIEAALERIPNHPPALGALSRLYLKQNDFGAYAKAKTREGKALKGAPEAAAAYLEAGRVYRDQLDNPADARKSFQRALRE